MIHRYKAFLILTLLAALTSCSIEEQKGNEKQGQSKSSVEEQGNSSNATTQEKVDQQLPEEIKSCLKSPCNKNQTPEQQENSNSLEELKEDFKAAIADLSCQEPTDCQVIGESPSCPNSKPSYIYSTLSITKSEASDLFEKVITQWEYENRDNSFLAVCGTPYQVECVESKCSKVSI